MSPAAPAVEKDLLTHARVSARRRMADDKNDMVVAVNSNTDDGDVWECADIPNIRGHDVGRHIGTGSITLCIP